MDKVPSFGTAAREAAALTMASYAPLLQANASAIRSTPAKTFSYGPHTRQELDVYYPPSPSSSSSSSSSSPPATAPSPVLVFFHGGGFVAGGKTVTVPPGNADDLPAWADGLAYANIGHFFASAYGITTICANYRVDRHGAVFPSGGEDVSLVVKWVQENLQTGALGGTTAGPRKLFLAGHSAGSIHLMTYLFHHDFAEQRTALVANGAPLVLSAAVSISGPFDLDEILPERAAVLNRYFKGDVKSNLPQALINRATARAGEALLPGVRILITDTEFDVPDEIVKPSAAAAKALNEHRRCDVLHIPGHNHFSQLYALGTGIKREEAWGHVVACWLGM